MTTPLTDNELDDLLARLNDLPPASSGTMSRIHEQIVAGARRPGVETAGRSWKRRLVIVTVALAAAACAALIVPALPSTSRTLAPSVEAAEVLDRAAAGITFSSEDLHPGQYRLIETHAWWLSVGPDSAFLGENILRTWEPYNPLQTWRLSRIDTGNVVWIFGDQKTAHGAAKPQDSWPTEVREAKCGDFYATDDGRQPCTQVGSWGTPTVEFMASLPRDPDALYKVLINGANSKWGDGAWAFDNAKQILATGFVPPDLRAALYQAIGRVPGMTITPDVTNLDGKRGTAVGLTLPEDVAGGSREEFIIDPKTGDFVGARTIETTSADGIPAGATTESTSVTTRMVTAIGATR